MVSGHAQLQSVHKNKPSTCLLSLIFLKIPLPQLLSLAFEKGSDCFSVFKVVTNQLRFAFNLQLKFRLLASLRKEFTCQPIFLLVVDSSCLHSPYFGKVVNVRLALDKLCFYVFKSALLPSFDKVRAVEFDEVV